MKKIICTAISIRSVIAIGFSSTFAMNTINSDFKTNQNLTNIVDEKNNLTELLVKGKENYKMLDVNGNSIISQFSISILLMK